jgi:hypothetical protein
MFDYTNETVRRKVLTTRAKFLIIKPTRCTNLSNLFWKEILHVSDSFSVHHQKFFTLHTAMVYVIEGCRQLASSIRMELSSILILLNRCQQTCMTYTTVLCKVENSWWWTEELSETCRISYQNKFEKLIHLKEGKAVPLQAWSGPEDSRKLSLPDFVTTAQDSGKIVSPTHRPHLPPRNIPGTLFC